MRTSGAIVGAVLVSAVACASCGKRSRPTRTYASKGCVPRPVDAVAACTPRPPGSADRVSDVFLEGPDTSGDQGAPTACVGLLLETRFAGGVSCRQRIGSFESVGFGDDVYVDDAPVCLEVVSGTLRVRRGDAIAASVPAPVGVESLAAFRARRCRE